MTGSVNKGSFPTVFSEQRLRVLRRTELMAPVPEPAFDRVTRAAAKLLGVRVAFVSLVDERVNLVKSMVSPEPPSAAEPVSVDLEHSFCKFIVESGRRLVVSDARRHELVKDNPSVREYNVVAYAGIPIVAQQEAILGALCVCQETPRDWSEHELEVLEELARLISLEVDLRMSARLMRENESLYRTLAANVPNGAVLLMDRDFRYVLAEGADVFETLGMTASDILGKTVFELLPPDEHDRLRSTLGAVFRGEPRRYESRRAGRAFETHAVPFGGRDGQVEAAMLLVYDVTQSRQTQDALEERTLGLERRTRHIELLQRIASQVNLAKGSADAMRACLEQMCGFTGWVLGHAYVLDAETNQMVPTDIWYAQELSRFHRFIEASENLAIDGGVGFVGMVQQTGRAESIVDVRVDPIFVRSQAAIASGLVSGFAFPVLIEDRVVAVLEFYAAKEELLDEDVRALMTNVGTQLGRAVERDLHARTVEAMSITDELTGLHNRRGFLVVGAQQMQVVKRAKQTMLLVYADLDGLKRINDERGHEAGDRYLRRAADILRSTFRRSDLLARLGGDEFVVLTSGAGPEAEHLLRARLDKATAQANAQYDDDLTVAMSVGISSHDPSSTETLETMLAHADEQMYRVKRERKKNQQSSAPPTSTSRALEWQKSLRPLRR